MRVHKTSLQILHFSATSVQGNFVAQVFTGIWPISLYWPGIYIFQYGVYLNKVLLWCFKWIWLKRALENNPHHWICFQIHWHMSNSGTCIPEMNVECCILFKMRKWLFIFNESNFDVNIVRLLFRTNVFKSSPLRKKNQNQYLGPDFGLPINLEFKCYQIENESRPFI